MKMNNLKELEKLNNLSFKLLIFFTIHQFSWKPCIGEARVQL